MINIPVIKYKMVVVEFKGITYRLSDRGYAGISFEAYGDYEGWYPIDEEEVADAFNVEERYAMEMMFDQ